MEKDVFAISPRAANDRTGLKGIVLNTSVVLQRVSKGLQSDEWTD